MNNIARKLQDNLYTKQAVVIDPATVMLIMSLVSAVIKIWQDCKKKPEEAVVVAQYPTSRERRVLKRIIRRELGLVKYWREGDKYYEAMLQTGQELNTQDIKDAYEENLREKYGINPPVL